jgi:hypothetical protein
LSAETLSFHLLHGDDAYDLLTLKLARVRAGHPPRVAGAVGVPLLLGILGGTPAHWAQYARAYRDAWVQVAHPAGIAVAVHGFVGADNPRDFHVLLKAKALSLPCPHS